VTDPIPFHAIPIEVSKHMAGFKYAVQFGDGPVYVSPAMYELVKDATPEELETLLKNLPLKRLPALPSLRDVATLPMFSVPPHLAGEPSACNRAAAEIELSYLLRRRSGRG
jgi:hypothetical protein